MKLLLNLLFSLHSAFAQSPRVQILMAPRYPDLLALDFGASLAKLATLRAPGEFEQVIIAPNRPILGDEDSIFAEVRRRVLSTSVTEPLNIQLVIDSHGSTTAIHSEECDPVPFAEFASQWRALMSEFVNRGYRPENLTFDLILHFCFAGDVKDQLGPALPFDTLIINSAQSGNLAIGPVLNDMFKRAIPAYVAAVNLQESLCEHCGEQEVLFLLLNHIYRNDLRTGLGLNREKNPLPEIEWWPASARDTQSNLPKLARKLFDLFARAIHDRETNRTFTNTLRFTLNEYGEHPLGRAVRAETTDLSPLDRIIRAHLLFHRRLESGMSQDELNAHFDMMRSYPHQDVRDAAIHDLLMLGDMVTDADQLYAKQADVELAQPNPDPARLRLHVEYLQEYKTPVAVAACQRLLEALGR